MDYFPDDFLLLHRRVAHFDSAGAGNVRRGSLAQGSADRLRFPLAVGAATTVRSRFDEFEQMVHQAIYVSRDAWAV